MLTISLTNLLRLLLLTHETPNSSSFSMSFVLHYLLFLFITTTTFFLTLSSAQNDTAPCPLDFSLIRSLVAGSKGPTIPRNQECRYILQGLRLVESVYLQRTGSFLPPPASAASCWLSYQSTIRDFVPPNFDIRTSCGFQTGWISQGCMNITTRAQLEASVPASAINDVVSNCNVSLDNNSPCAVCTTSLSRLQALYLNGTTVGNVSDCQAYSLMYAAAVANRYGPTDKGTAKCLFSLDIYSENSGKRKSNVLILVVVVIVCVVGLLIGIGGCWFLRRKYGVLKGKKKRDRIGGVEIGLSSPLDSISRSTTLVKFTFDEIRKATRNFSRDNIIGRGGYGNVYKGELPDGTQVAIKRFKNCSAAGEATFCHEIEVIASVRHVNLVAMRGYCTATTQFEGHQRIIVCDLVKNGSLYDHLFGSSGEKLSWPIRQKIALGTARGLAYLHYGAQQTIIHRDIKASNILLDERFEAKVADFGLARFTPEGMTHVSTRVAGTMGYVAPEYALYGQLTERSDVYSFGVVLLELLSGKKALIVSEEGQPSHVTDWAWSLVRDGRALDVIEDGMPELGAQDVVEKYVLVAVLCSHPQLYARPAMDQVVKMLETDLTLPSIPERPIPLVAEMDDIERSMSSSFSGQLSSPAGYRPYMFETDGGPSSSGNREEASTSDSRTVELL